MLLHGNVLVFYGCVEQPIIFSISNFDEGTNVQILGAGSATSTAECRMGCRLYLVRVLVTTVIVLLLIVLELKYCHSSRTIHTCIGPFRVARNVSFSFTITHLSPNSSYVLILYHVIILLIIVIAVVIISLFIT